MNTWQFIYNKQSASVDVMLLYVLHSQGSSPGRQGFKMAVAADNSFCGSIGGGIMEHKFVEMAKAALEENTGATAIYRQMHDKSAGKNKSGMICSGEQSIFLYQVQVEDLIYIQALLKSLQANKNGLLRLSNSGILFLNETPEADFYFEQKDESNFFLIEKTGYKNQLHIIGGGHCALALSRLISSMDFYIKVYDDRQDLNTLEQNSYAHEKIIVSSYSALETIIESGNNVYVVIMTFGYRTDDLAVKALLKKTFKYIGLLGSKKKAKKMFKDYKAEKIEDALLTKIHSPIGIQIKSETPEEIAISIAAEIIAVKNQPQ
ncbi:MAG: XdhC family protein [Ferruginibacter sp.]